MGWGSAKMLAAFVEGHGPPLAHRASKREQTSEWHVEFVRDMRRMRICRIEDTRQARMQFVEDMRRMRTELDLPHCQPNPMSPSYVWMSPHPRTRHQHLSPFTIIYAPPRRQRSPRRVMFRLPKAHKYSPGILYVVSVPSSIYCSPTLSHSFDASDEHPREEQVYAPWGP
jgi:hypothetical protein